MRGCYRKRNKETEPGNERERMGVTTRERERESVGEKKERKKKKKYKIKNKTQRENAKLSQGYFVGREAMGYFQSQNYTKERLSTGCSNKASRLNNTTNF